MVDYYSEGAGPQSCQADIRDGRKVEVVRDGQTEEINRDGRPVEVERVREGFFLCWFLIVLF